jgi:hypothetical protein
LGGDDEGDGDAQEGDDGGEEGPSKRCGLVVWRLPEAPHDRFPDLGFIVGVEVVLLILGGLEVVVVGSVGPWVVVRPLLLLLLLLLTLLEER